MKKHIKEEHNENAIQQKSAGTFANDQTQEAQESAQLIQLAAENEEKSSDQALQKLADGQKNYSGGGGGGDDSPPSNNGIPNDMQKGFEQYSGTSFDNVKVHKNSSKPKQLKAHAYAQGNEVHLGPGQEKHLPH